MRAPVVGRMRVAMAALASSRLLERGFLAKGENAVAPPGRGDVLAGITVTVEAGERLPRARLPRAVIEHAVRPRMGGLELLDVAGVTEPDRLREIGLIDLRLEARTPEQTDTYCGCGTHAAHAHDHRVPGGYVPQCSRMRMICRIRT